MTADNPGFPIRKPPAGPPPNGGGTGRVRSRYAPDDQAKRAAKLALELGVKLRLGADGSVTILGKLDTASPAALASAGEESADDALDAFEAGRGAARGRA